MKGARSLLVVVLGCAPKVEAPAPISPPPPRVTEREHQAAASEHEVAEVKQEPPPAEFVTATREFARRMCECDSVKCTIAVAEEQTAWLSANADKAAALTSLEAEEVAKAGTKMAECITALATKEASP